MKNHFYSIFVQKNIGEKSTTKLINEQGEYTVDPSYEPEYFKNQELMDDWLVFRNMVQEQITKVENERLGKYKTASKTLRIKYELHFNIRKENIILILGSLLSIVDSILDGDNNEISIHYFTYLMLKKTELNVHRIYYLLRQYGLQRAINVNKSLKTYVDYENHYQKNKEGDQTLREYYYHSYRQLLPKKVTEIAINKQKRKTKLIKDRHELSNQTAI